MNGYKLGVSFEFLVSFIYMDLKRLTLAPFTNMLVIFLVTM
jgi:hypothetical protein